ncbi:phage virion morphogenesis protein [Robbsia andropogonis]|uniref:phage virion morphogenesis protein n=1 Tax=Robbsia andropogonis TaxID=28092 RepID=UPI003D2240B6
MTDDILALEELARGMLARLSTGQRRTVTKDIAHELRRSQQARIAAQRNPDGSAYVPRKASRSKAPTKGKKGLRQRRLTVKQQAMFRKLRTASHLKMKSDASGLEIGFAGRVARIARVHQEGGTTVVATGGPRHRYAQRTLLGLAAADVALVRNRLLAHIGA